MDADGLRLRDTATEVLGGCRYTGRVGLEDNLMSSRRSSNIVLRQPFLPGALTRCLDQIHVEKYGP